MSDGNVRKGRVPAEIVNIGAGAGAIMAVVATGAGLSSVIPEHSAWLTLSAYLAPASLAFAAYWWITQK